MSLLNDLAVSGLLPTPTANDAKNVTLPASLGIRKGGLPKKAMQNDEYRTGTGSRLNPLYVAEMNNENDQEQWYSYTEYPTNESKNGVRRLIFNEHTRFDSFVDVPSGYYRKATVEEIVEYFKNNEK